jgi:hypothetical protein
MEIVKNGIKQIKFSGGKLFLPYYNLWNQDVYRMKVPFRHSPTMTRANSTSGSPVLLGENFFAGFLHPHLDSEFSFDGHTVTCTAPEDQELYYSEGDPLQIWKEYNQYVASGFQMKDRSKVTALPEIEYCTWMEQKKAALKYYGGSGMNETINALNDRFVDDYIHRINKLKLPKGVLTLDHGWAIGSENFDFDLPRPDTAKFNDFAATIRRIKNAGFIPGLWFAPAFCYKTSSIYKKYPELIGEKFTGANEGGFEFPVYYFNVTQENREILLEWFKKIFSPYIEMGVRKLKIDFTYNNKSMMIKIIELLNNAVKSICEDVEIEGHIPDIFATPYQDAVRLNDIVPKEGLDWQGLFNAHYEVCSGSAWKTQLNLDHIGTNFVNISEEDFLKSLTLFKDKKGYPVVSMLPDHFSDNTVSVMKDYLERYDNNKHEILDGIML